MSTAKKIKSLDEESAKESESNQLRLGFMFIKLNKKMYNVLKMGDWKTFAHYVAASQAGAERALENQQPETTALVREGLNAGAIAASAFGAGFGGSVWALIPVTDAKDFSTRWRAAYEQVAPTSAARAQFFTTRPGPPAFEIQG